jgi:hypothetical protein
VLTVVIGARMTATAGSCRSLAAKAGDPRALELNCGSLGVMR